MAINHQHGDCPYLFGGAMGSFTRMVGGLSAAMLMGAGVAAEAPTTAQARALVNVPCNTPALITAISNANTAGSGTLRLASSCTYRLTTAATVGTRGPDGLPIITGNITIIGGPSTTIRRVAGSPVFRIFEIATTGRLAVNGIFIVGGDAGLQPGGGFLNARGRLSLVRDTVSGNTADNGAAIANDSGAVDVIRSIVNANSTGGGGGGGAIYNDGTLRLILSRLSGNRANTSGGAVFNEQGGTVSAFRVTLDNNVAVVNGGGLYNGVGGRASLVRTLVERNTAASGGGIFNAATVGSVTLSSPVIRRNIPNNCSPAGTIRGCTG
jgi:hypothetical protein